LQRHSQVKVFAGASKAVPELGVRLTIGESLRSPGQLPGLQATKTNLL